jgi:hypothetical protein
MRGNAMRWKKRWITVPGLVVLAFSLLLSWSCESGEKHVGKYTAVQENAPNEEDIFVELKPNGEGIWVVGTQEVSFSWYIKKGDLRINTKEGGVLVGKIKDDTFTITVPGRGKMLFKKSQ